jgi:hypothetical protein
VVVHKNDCRELVVVVFGIVLLKVVFVVKVVVELEEPRIVELEKLEQTTHYELIK